MRNCLKSLHMLSLQLGQHICTYKLWNTYSSCSRVSHPAVCVREPHKVCELCSSVLVPLQPVLIEMLSMASQTPVHDVWDSTVLRSWLNNPVTRSLEQDIYKATNILQEVKMVRACRKDLKVASVGFCSFCNGFSAVSWMVEWVFSNAALVCS